MKHSDQQILVAAKVRELALEYWRLARNSLHAKWHAENPDQVREMKEFEDELNKSTPFNKFVIDAAAELDRVAEIIFTLPKVAAP